jgi:hypothetical protein
MLLSRLEKLFTNVNAAPWLLNCFSTGLGFSFGKVFFFEGVGSGPGEPGNEGRRRLVTKTGDERWSS